MGPSAARRARTDIRPGDMGRVDRWNVGELRCLTPSICDRSGHAAVTSPRRSRSSRAGLSARHRRASTPSSNGSSVVQRVPPEVPVGCTCATAIISTSALPPASLELQVRLAKRGHRRRIAIGGLAGVHGAPGPRRPAVLRATGAARRASEDEAELRARALPPRRPAGRSDRSAGPARRAAHRCAGVGDPHRVRDGPGRACGRPDPARSASHARWPSHNTRW